MSTCPELSSDFSCGSEKMDCQSKPLSGNLDSRTDSAPSMLPVPQSTASASDTHRQWVSHSVAGVGMTQPAATASDTHLAGVGVTGQRGQDVTDVGGRQSDTCATAASKRPPASDTLTSATEPAVGHATDTTTTQLPQTEAMSQSLQSVASVDAAAVRTSTPNTSTNVAARGLFSCDAVYTAESGFVYHEENARDHMITTSSHSSLPVEFDGNFTVSSPKPSVGNSERVDTSLSDETVAEALPVSDGGSRHVFAVVGPAAEMPYVDESVEMSDAAVSQPHDAMIVSAADEESTMSTAACNEVCQLSSAAVDDTTMSFSSAVAECGSHNDSRSSLNDTRLVSKLIIIITRMWANAQRDGRPAEHRWRPLFNAAKFG